MVDLSPLFSLCLSREFTTKLWGFLALDYTYLGIPFKNNRVKIINEGTSLVHIKIILEDKSINVSNTVEIIQVDPIKEALTTIIILFLEDISYIAIDVGMRKYFLHEKSQIIFISKKKKSYEVYILMVQDENMDLEQV